MIEYHKLVRDKIPALIEAQGETPVYRVLGEAEYSRYLKDKLSEEVAEFLRDQTAEELADILEVVYALGEDLGYSPEELEKIRREKAEKRGAFRGKIFLIGKEG